jgi:hypothetical protein
MRGSLLSAFAVLGALGAATGCHDGSEGDADADADGDADADADADRGSIDDADADGGSDTDADVDEDSPPSPTWTLMFYLDGDGDVEEDMAIQLDLLERVEQPSWLRIVALYDRAPGYYTSDGDWTGTRLYLVHPDGGAAAVASERLADPEFLGLSDTGDADELNMADGETLRLFIEFSQAAFPADHYGLVFCGHGNGWAKGGPDLPGGWGWRSCCSDETSGNDSLRVEEDIGVAIAGQGIDVLGFDACLMGMIEVAWALKDDVDYFVASEEESPRPGWDSATWLAHWLDGDPTPDRLAAEAVEAFRLTYEGMGGLFLLTMAAFETSGLPAIRDAIDDFVVSYDPSAYLGAEFGGMRSYDLYRIAFNAGCEPIMAAIRDARVAEWHSTPTECPGGLAIFYGPSTGYPDIAFCQDCDWCDYIPAE